MELREATIAASPEDEVPMRTLSRRRTWSGTMALALSLSLAACGGAARSASGGMNTPPSEGPPRPGIERARADSARLPWTEADARFMTNMIGHHSQAIVMARLAPTHDASPSVRTLAERIINAQQDEIATMQAWLRDRLQPVPDPEGMAGMHAMHHGAAAGGTSGAAGNMSGMDHSAMQHALMPGMLTAEQLQQLDAARGAEFDRLFLTFMIQHHRGATQMVRDLFGSYGAAQDETVFKFASDVNVDQTTEIARMQRMLVALQLGAGSP
jgi:uncharacterized protein (DUF305 family)